MGFRHVKFLLITPNLIVKNYTSFLSGQESNTGCEIQF